MAKSWLRSENVPELCLIRLSRKFLVLLYLDTAQTRRESVPIVREKLSQRVHEHERHEHGQRAPRRCMTRR